MVPSYGREWHHHRQQTSLGVERAPDGVCCTRSCADHAVRLCELRPPVVRSLSHMSHSGAEETLLDEGETASGLWCVFGLVLVFCLVFFVWFGVACVLFSPIV